jgi:hypothetical protein
MQEEKKIREFKSMTISRSLAHSNKGLVCSSNSDNHNNIYTHAIRGPILKCLPVAFVLISINVLLPLFTYSLNPLQQKKRKEKEKKSVVCAVP